MMTKGFIPSPLKKVAVLGFGTMGRGIVIEIIRNKGRCFRADWNPGITKISGYRPLTR